MDAGGDGGAGGSTPALLDEYVLSDDMLVPESGIFDPTSRSFYVGSATKGNITQVEADGTESILFAPPASETWRTLGMTADDAGAETVKVWADDPLLSPNSGGIFGGNGIAVTEDDSFVIVSKTSTGAPPRLLRIAHDDPASIDELVATPALEGFADGMSFLGGDLYIAMVAAGDVARLTSDDNWATASVVSVAAEPGAPVPGISTVRPAEGALYAIYSDITSELLGIDPTPPF